MHRVGARSERRTSAATIRGVTGFFAVNHVGSDGEYGLGRGSTTVHFVAGNFFHEAFNQVAGNAVNTFVVVAELRVFAFDFKVHSDAVFVTHRTDFGVFDGRERVGGNGESGDTASHGAVNVAVM